MQAGGHRTTQVAGLQRTDRLSGLHGLPDLHRCRHRLVRRAQAVAVSNRHDAPAGEHRGVADRPGTGGAHRLPRSPRQIHTPVPWTVRRCRRVERPGDHGLAVQREHPVSRGGGGRGQQHPDGEDRTDQEPDDSAHGATLSAVGRRRQRRTTGVDNPDGLWTVLGNCRTGMCRTGLASRGREDVHFGAATHTSGPTSRVPLPAVSPAGTTTTLVPVRRADMVADRAPGRCASRPPRQPSSVAPWPRERREGRAAWPSSL